MKKSDKLVLATFVGPFLATFFVSLFILLMQFLWKYIDDLVGKGLEWTIIARLLFYSCANLIPLALIITTLLSMLMTMGQLGENYELTALKTAGVSLIRIMRPLMIVAIIITVVAFLFSNYILPVANLKEWSLAYDIGQQKPAVNIKQGVFYNGIDNYSIHIGRKGADNKSIYDVIIYDQSSHQGDVDVIYARKGEMQMTADKRDLIFTLYDGYEFQEMIPGDLRHDEMEQTRTSFKTWQKILDLSEFKFNRTKEDLFKENFQMLNLKQLDKVIDTFNMGLKQKYNDLKNFVTPNYNFLRPDVREAMLKAPPDTTKSDSSFLSTIPYNDRMQVLQESLNNARNVKQLCFVARSSVDNTNNSIIRYKIEWWRKFSLSLACFILFLVGAPLGAIIRKGGIGLPVVIAIVLFVILYVISLIGEKLAKDGTVSPFFGMWLADFILLPFGVFLVYKATHDSNLFNIEAYTNLFKQIAIKLRLMPSEQ